MASSEVVMSPSPNTSPVKRRQLRVTEMQGDGMIASARKKRAPRPLTSPTRRRSSRSSAGSTSRSAQVRLDKLLSQVGDETPPGAGGVVSLRPVLAGNGVHGGADGEDVENDNPNALDIFSPGPYHHLQDGHEIDENQLHAHNHHWRPYVDASSSSLGAGVGDMSSVSAEAQLQRSSACAAAAAGIADAAGSVPVAMRDVGVDERKYRLAAEAGDDDDEAGDEDGCGDDDNDGDGDGEVSIDASAGRHHDDDDRDDEDEDEEIEEGEVEEGELAPEHQYLSQPVEFGGVQYADADERDQFIFIKSLPPLQDDWLRQPPVLPRKSRHTPKNTLVLDLDETLVHSTTEESMYGPADMVFPVLYNKQEYVVSVFERPGMRQFLQTVAQLYEVIVFTASQRVYADKLLTMLDPTRELIKHRVFRDSCVCVDGNYIKDLNVLGRDLARTMIIDNSPQAFGYQMDNGIPIESYFFDKSDRELLELLPFLEKMADVDDVRPHVRNTFRMYSKLPRT